MNDQVKGPHSADETESISKTQKKQMVHDLKDFAKSLTELAKNKLTQLELPDELSDAITESKRITSHIARKRHFQYMAKLLLKLDHGEIQAKLDRLNNLDGHYQIRDAIINLWIEQLAEHEKTLFDYLYQHHEHETLSNLRQTLRNHRKKPDLSANRKKLFQCLRNIDNQVELPNPMTLL